MEKAEFSGNRRFRIVRRLGAGGMGVVYEAEDAERQERVALKTLKHRDADTIYQLKREFRALADLSHPNLVSLYDLFVDEDACFFTMELIRGKEFLSWCAVERGKPGESVDVKLRVKGEALLWVSGMFAGRRVASSGGDYVEGSGGYRFRAVVDSAGTVEVKFLRMGLW